MNQDKLPGQLTVNISVKTILTITFVVLLPLVAWQIKGVFVVVFLAFILNSALRPYIDYFETKKIHRSLSIAVIFILLFVIVSLIMVSVISETVIQVRNLILALPTIITQTLTELVVLFPWLEEVIDINNLQQQFVVEIADFNQLIGTTFSSGISSAFVFLNSAFSVMVSVFTITVLTFYMLVRNDDVYASLLYSLPISEKQKYVSMLQKIEFKLGAWLRAQLFLMLFVGFFTWLLIMLPSLFFDDYVLHQFALPIALLAAILESVPNLGPALTGIIALVIAAGSGSSLLVLIYVLIIFIIIQQTEAVFITPQVMHKVIGIDPIITIISVIGAYILFGIFGALLIIPMIAVLQIVINTQFFDKSNKKENIIEEV